MSTAKIDETGIADFDDIDPEDCPCGSSRRAFVDDDGSMSLHKVEISREEKPHRHDTDEIYYILDCGPDARMFLDSGWQGVKKGQAVKIKGGTWHCADRGSQPMIVLVVVATGHGSPEAQMEFFPD